MFHVKHQAISYEQQRPNENYLEVQEKKKKRRRLLENRKTKNGNDANFR